MALLGDRIHTIAPHPGGAEQLEAVERISILFLACVHSESWSWHFQRVEDWWGLHQESCGGSTQDGAQKVPDLSLTVGFCFPFPVQRRGQQPPVPVRDASLLERRREGESLSHPEQDSTAQLTSVTPSAASFVVPLMSERLPEACPESLVACIPAQRFLLPRDAPGAPGSVV